MIESVTIPEDAPIKVTQYLNCKAYCVRVIEDTERAEDELATLVSPPGGFKTAQEAVDWLVACGLSERGGDLDFPNSEPWLGMTFEVLAVNTPSTFMQYCSW